MKTLITKRVGGIRDRFLMHTSRIGSATQVLYGLFFSEKLFNEAVRRGRRTGEYLYECLPPKALNHVRSNDFDPYNHDLSQDDILRWLWDHVIFDPDGNIVGVHDRGYILTNQHGWTDEVAWFGRVKEAEWRKANG
jgi:hypothetical protein